MRLIVRTAKSVTLQLLLVIFKQMYTIDIMAGLSWKGQKSSLCFGLE